MRTESYRWIVVPTNTHEFHSVIDFYADEEKALEQAKFLSQVRALDVYVAKIEYRTKAVASVEVIN